MRLVQDLVPKTIMHFLVNDVINVLQVNSATDAMSSVTTIIVGLTFDLVFSFRLSYVEVVIKRPWDQIFTSDRERAGYVSRYEFILLTFLCRNKLKLAFALGFRCCAST